MLGHSSFSRLSASFVGSCIAKQRSRVSFSTTPSASRPASSLAATCPHLNAVIRSVAASSESSSPLIRFNSSCSNSKNLVASTIHQPQKLWHQDSPIQPKQMTQRCLKASKRASNSHIPTEYSPTSKFSTLSAGVGLRSNGKHQLTYMPPLLRPYKVFLPLALISNLNSPLSFHTKAGTMAKNSKDDTGNKPEHTHSHEIGNQHEHKHDEHSHEHAHSLFGHSHSHSSADNIFVQEHGGLKNPAIRITWVGLLSNLGMAIGKAIGGVMFHSQALFADAIHSFSDLISDFLTLATVSVAARPPNAEFPNGYGKIETLGSLGVSALLLLAGVSVGWSGLIAILQQFLGDNHFLDIVTQYLGHGHSHSHVGSAAADVANSVGSGHSHSHSHASSTDLVPAQDVDLNAMWIAVASIGIKEWLFRATMKIAKSTGSSVLIANAWHHRVDSLTSVVAVATIGSSYFFGLSWLDSLGGLIVSCVIIQAGFKNGYTAALELADSSKTVPLDIVDSNTEAVRTALSRAVAEKTMKLGDFDINKVIVMSSGPNYTTNVILQTRPTMDVKTATAVAGFVEKELLSHDPRLKNILVKYIDTDTLRLAQSFRKEKQI